MSGSTPAEWQDPGHANDAVVGLTTQEQYLRFTTFTSETAFAIGEGIRNAFEKYHAQRGQSALISIRLWSGLTLYQVACGPQVTPNNEEWVQRKTNTVRSYGKSSFLVGRELIVKGRDINSLGPTFAAHGGAIPILIKGVGSIGAVIVSGLAQWEDHSLAFDAMKFVQIQQANK